MEDFKSNDYKFRPLESVCIINTGKRDPREKPNESFIYIDITSVDNIDKIITQKNRIPGKDAPSRARKIIKSDDVILSTTRPNLNAVALISDDLDNQICSTGFCVLRAREDIVIPKYIFYFTQSANFVYSLSNLVQGALYPAVKDSQVFVGGQSKPAT